MSSPVLLRRLPAPVPSLRALRAFAWVLSSTLLLACGEAGPVDPGDGGTTGSFTIAAAPTTLTVQQGASGNVAVGIVRLNGFAGDVSLTVSGAPTGVTATPSPAVIAASLSGTNVSVAVSLTAAVATTTITINATGPGVASQSTTFTLAVTAAPAETGPFALSLSVSSYLALTPPAGSAFPVLTITRDPGFTGPVSFTVSGLPPALAAGIVPSNVTTSTASLVVAQAGVPNGTYTATIRGTATGLGSRTITLPITVSAPTTGSVTWTFCESAPRFPQFFFAVKDGAGPWTRITPNGHSYSFNVAQTTGAVAMVTAENGGYRTTVYHYTAAEIAAAGASDCVLYPSSSTRSVDGTVTGLGTGDQSVLGMGWWFASTVNPLGGTVSNYSLLNLPVGPLDFVAVRTSVLAVTDRVIIRRALNPASGASLAPVDFNDSEPFSTTTSTWTFGNLGGASFSVNQAFLTAGGTAALLKSPAYGGTTTTTRVVYGVPLAQTVDGDLHQVVATVGDLATNRATRQVVAYRRTLADESLDFGPDMTAATVSVVAGGPTGRLRATGTTPIEYDDGIAFDMEQANSPARYATIYATRGALAAGLDYDVQLPDLSAVLGWDTNFQLRPGVEVKWWLSGGGPILDPFDTRFIFNSTRHRWAGAMTGIVAPAEGQEWKMGRTNGTITP